MAAGTSDLQVQQKQEIATREAERTRERVAFVPRVDVYETNESIFVVAEMPGVDENSVDITLEDGIINGGLGSAVMKFKNEYGYTGKVVPLGIPDEFILHGSIPELQKYCGFDPEGIKSTVRGLLNKENSAS